MGIFERTRNGLVAALEGARAASQLARINLQNTKIVAPVDGQLGEVAAHLGLATGSEISMLKADNATKNFTKIAQCIPVHIELDPGEDLAKRLTPRESVSVAVDTADASADNNVATTR